MFVLLGIISWGLFSQKECSAPVVMVLVLVMEIQVDRNMKPTMLQIKFLSYSQAADSLSSITAFGHFEAWSLLDLQTSMVDATPTDILCSQAFSILPRGLTTLSKSI